MIKEVFPVSCYTYRYSFRYYNYDNYAVKLHLPGGYLLIC